VKIVRITFETFAGTLKARDWRTRDQIAGVENAGQPSMEREMFTYA